MANIASAQKQNRKMIRHRARNRAAMGAIRTAVKSARAAVDEKNGDAPKTVKKAIATIDSAVSKGILKRNDSMVVKRSRDTVEHRPRVELYDLAKDPDELKNVAADPAYADVLRELRGKLRTWQVATKDPWLIKEMHE